MQPAMYFVFFWMAQNDVARVELPTVTDHQVQLETRRPAQNLMMTKAVLKDESGQMHSGFPGLV